MTNVSITIRLPWPPGGLHPHAKGHWHRKAGATKRYRADAHWLARAAGVSRDPEAVLTFTYQPPDHRRRDAQNMPGMLKAAVDGIADAMGCDDNRFRCRFPDRFDDPVPGGAILVQIGRDA